MTGDIKQTGMVVKGIVTDVSYIDQIGKTVISLLVAGMDTMLKVTLPKGKMPDPKVYEPGNLVQMKIIVTQWNGNTYFNEATTA